MPPVTLFIYLPRDIEGFFEAMEEIKIPRTRENGFKPFFIAPGIGEDDHRATMILESQGYKVVTARDGIEGLAWSEPLRLDTIG